ARPGRTGLARRMGFADVAAPQNAAGRRSKHRQRPGARRLQTPHRPPPHKTAARWPGTLWVCRVNRMAGLCTLMYSHQWHTYWETA
ncbi:MAG: hypothetical protein AB7U20_21840, partial [Planctomycetaceae bacterium]